MKKTLVIFDCFGVIVGEIAPVIFRKYFSAEEAARIKDEVCRPADLGIISEQELYDSVGAAIGESAEFVRAEYERMGCVNKSILPIIEKLGQRADIALLSNAMPGFADRLLDRFCLKPLFDKIFLSCEHNMVKPDPSYYRLCVDSFGKEYERIFMIDDNPDNLLPLEAMGIKPVLFKSAESITENLELKKLL